MQFKDLKAVKKALDERGHSMLFIDDTLICEHCEKWAKMRVPNDHAYGDAIGSNCNIPETTPKQKPAKINPDKKRSKTNETL